MSRILFDTCVYVPWIRDGRLAEFADNNPEKHVFLSVVVAQELYAGAKDPFTQKALHQFFSVFQKRNSLITPSTEEWLLCGGILSKISQRYGFETTKKSRLVNDVLIAMSCRRVDATLITSNLKDFRLIQEFLKIDLEAG